MSTIQVGPEADDLERVLALEPELTLGGRMRLARLQAGLEQAELAERVGVARATAGSWERDRTEPSVTAAKRWALATGVSFGWLADVPPRSR